MKKNSSGNISNKEENAKAIDKTEEIQYSKHKFSFQHKNSPSEKESGSEAHRLAVWWAHRSDVQSGDQTLISMNDRWYLVEKFDDADNHYQVEEYITKSEFNKIYKEIERNGKVGKIKFILAAPDGYDRNNQRYHIFNERESSIDSYETQYGREGSKVVRLDRDSIEGRERVGRDGSGNREGGSANRQGDSISYSRRVTHTQSEIKAATEDMVEMLTVAGNINEEQFDVSTRKNYDLKRITADNAVIYWNEKTTVVAVVSDKHLDLCVQTEYVGVKKETLLR